MKQHKRILTGLLWLLLALLSGCDQAPLMARIRDSGKLVVGLKQDTGYYKTPAGAAGFELELLRRFAASLQLSLQLKTYPSDEQLIKALLRGEVYMAARISRKVTQGVVCMPHGYWPSLMKGGSSANALTDHLLTDMGRGGAIQEAKVEILKA
mgnify:CR=1 FL=1